MALHSPSLGAPGTSIEMVPLHFNEVEYEEGRSKLKDAFRAWDKGVGTATDEFVVSFNGFIGSFDPGKRISGRVPMDWEGVVSVPALSEAAVKAGFCFSAFKQAIQEDASRQDVKARARELHDAMERFRGACIVHSVMPSEEEQRNFLATMGERGGF